MHSPDRDGGNVDVLHAHEQVADRSSGGVASVLHDHHELIGLAHGQTVGADGERRFERESGALVVPRNGLGYKSRLQGRRERKR